MTQTGGTECNVTMHVYLNDALIPAADARIDAADRGFTLGDGLFETIRAAAGVPLRLPAHLRRLRAGAAVLGLPVPLADDALAQAVAATVAANGLREAVVRLTLTRGPAPRGLLPPAVPTPTLLVTAAPAPAPGGPVRAILGTVTRRNQHSPLARVKSLNYLDNILARVEAADKGAEDAILLNTAGRLAETTIANLFLVVDGAVVTPLVAEGALPGVMRAEVIDRTGAVECLLTEGDLFRATEAFVTNATGIRPLATVDGRPVGGAGRVLERLLAT